MSYLRKHWNKNQRLFGLTGPEKPLILTAEQKAKLKGGLFYKPLTLNKTKENK